MDILPSDVVDANLVSTLHADEVYALCEASRGQRWPNYQCNSGSFWRRYGRRRYPQAVQHLHHNNRQGSIGAIVAASAKFMYHLKQALDQVDSITILGLVSTSGWIGDVPEDVHPEWAEDVAETYMVPETWSQLRNGRYIVTAEGPDGAEVTIYSDVELVTHLVNLSLVWLDQPSISPAIPGWDDLIKQTQADDKMQS